MFIFLSFLTEEKCFLKHIFCTLLFYSKEIVNFIYKIDIFVFRDQLFEMKLM